MSKTYKRDEFGKSPPKHWKRPRRARERAKQDQALREGKEMPVIKKSDRMEYW